MNDDDIQSERFVVSESPESVLSSLRYEGANSSRFAITGLLTSSAQSGLVGLSEEMNNFGFSERLAVDSLRSETLARPTERFATLREYFVDFQQMGTLRSVAWAQLNEGVSTARIAFLTAGLCSELERESAAAAVSLIGTLALPNTPSVDQAYWIEDIWTHILLSEYDYSYPNAWLGHHIPREIMGEVTRATWSWDSLEWPSFDVTSLMEALSELRSERKLKIVLNELAWMRVKLAYRSKDEISRQLVDALNSRPRGGGRNRGVGRRGPRINASEIRPRRTSTMVHGTWGWKGDWWYPDSSFHKYIKKKYRPNLYDEGQEFSWSGAYSQKDRGIAGDRFMRWVEAQEPRRGLGSVFAHSYGAEVVSRAVNQGSKIDELVFLSAPVNEHLEQAVNHVAHAVDVRLRFDLVLCLAAIFRHPDQSRPRQRFRPNPRISEFRSGFQYWDHGATHKKWFWELEDVAARTQLKRTF